MTEALLNKIGTDPLFLHHLTLCKNDPVMLDLLMREVNNGKQERSEIGTAELLTRVTSALAHWAASGFKRVNDDDHMRRLSVCWSCEHLTRPRGNPVYGLTIESRQKKSICGLCGCEVRRKAWLATERCPAGKWDRISG